MAEDLSRITELLCSPERAAVDKGLELLRALEEPAHARRLLNGCTLDSSGAPVLNSVLLRVAPASREHVLIALFLLSGRLADVERLSLSAFEGEDLGALPLGPALRTLRILHGPLKRLSGQPALQGLAVVGCPGLEDLTGVETMPSLRELSVINCPVADGAALAGHPALEELHLMALTLASLAGVRRLPRLQQLIVTSMRHLESLSGLAEVPALRKVTVSDCPTFRALGASLPGLETLRLKSVSSLADLSALAHSPRLRSLEIPHCPRPSVLSVLQELPSLETLDLKGSSQLTRLPSMEGLVKLRSLSLSGCAQLRDLRPLEALSSLETLDLTGCESVTDLGMLERFPDLQITAEERFQRIFRRTRQRKRRVVWDDETRRRKKRRSRKRNQKS
jgi:Leucine-rich repeat (LRR) protein